MLLIKNNHIMLTKGDYAPISLALYTPDKKPVELDILGDKSIVFRVRKNKDKNCGKPVIQKNFSIFEIEEGSNAYCMQIELEPEDTKFLTVGKYYWECEYTLELNEKKYVSTVCSGVLELTAELD